MDSLACQEMVVKPMVGASGKDIFRLKVGDKEGMEKIRRLCQHQDLLLQVIAQHDELI